MPGHQRLALETDLLGLPGMAVGSVPLGLKAEDATKVHDDEEHQHFLHVGKEATP